MFLGTYKIHFKKLEKAITLTIHKGVYWESDEYILTQKSLFNIGKKKIIKRILDLNITQTGQNDNFSKVTFKVEGAQKGLKVHCFAFNTLSFDNNALIRKYSDISSNQPRSLIKVKKATSNYLSNKKLNEELRYALERKYLKSFIGTTLERPTLLYKNKFFKDTYFNVPNQEMGGGYQKVHEGAQKLANCPVSYNSYNKRKMKKDGKRQIDVGSIYIKNHLDNYVTNDINGYLNFLDTPPFILPNIKEIDGEFSFNLNTNLFTNLMILAVDESGATQKIIDIPREEKIIPELKIRKIALEKPLDSKNHYQETRNAIVLKTGDEHIIEDITSVDYQSIDSLQKVGKVLQELLRLKHQESQPFTTTYWLYNWIHFDQEMKNKKYSMFMCNELNFFLYFKDKEYFEEVVKPSITAKIEKSLIDYFLLEEYEEMERYKKVSVIDNLNALEQCLLIAATNISNPEEAKILAENFKNKAKLVETKIAKKNHKFDTVLLMKIIESDEIDDEEDEKTKGSIKKKKKAPKRQKSMS